MKLNIWYVTLAVKVVHGEKVMLDDQEMAQRQRVRYLGSILNLEGEIGNDVNYKIKSSRAKWKSTLLILCD